MRCCFFSPTIEWLSEFHEDVNNEEKRARISRLLTKLTDAEREIVRLHYPEDIPLKKVGPLLGMSPNAARKRAKRALAKLAELPYSGEELLGQEPRQKVPAEDRAGVVYLYAVWPFTRFP